MKLTHRQQQVLDFIIRTQATTGIIPSTREIQLHFKFASQTAAVNHLRALEKKGIIRRQPGKARCVAIVSQLRREPVVDLPIYGSIAAGFAETLDQEQDGTLAIDTATVGLGKNKRAFGLKVRGDSMTGAGIYEGDLAILDNREPRAGAIVAALIDGETTLKRLVSERNKYYLKAENPKYPDLLPLAELSVQGVLVALIRKYKS